MRRLLRPDLRFQSVESIDFNEFRNNEIKYILLDLDNTLIDFDRNINDSVVNWVKSAKEQGFKVYILSNTNKLDKVAKVATILDVDFINNAKKPLKSGFRKAIDQFKLVPTETAMVGDQIFTDVIGANMMNMLSVYVDPISPKEHFYTKWKRPLESWILRKYQN